MGQVDTRSATGSMDPRRRGPHGALGGASAQALAPPGGGASPSKLRTRLIESLLALAAAATTGQTANIVSQLLLAAILLPADFGAISIAVTVTTAAQVARNAFVFQTLIHRSTRVRESADQITLVSIVLGVVLCGLVWWSANQIGEFFHAPESAQLLRLTSLAFLIDSIGAVPDTLFEKELRFRRKMWLEITKPILVAVFSVVFALAGMGPVSVGWAQLIGYSTWTVGLYILSDYRPRPRWDPRLLRQLLNYGRFVLGGSLLVFFFANLDNASVGRVLGPRALGYYAFAFLLGYTPAKVITEGIVAAVVLPIFSKVQTSREGQARALLTTLRYVGYYAAPMCVISIIIGPPALRALYGHKWAPAFVALQMLAVYGFAHSYFLVMRNFCNGTGRARFFWRISGLQLGIALPFLVAAPSQFGIAGTAAVFTFGKLCAALVGVAYGRHVTRMRLTLLLVAILRPAAVAAAAGALAFKILLLTGGYPGRGKLDSIAPALGAFVLIFLAGSLLIEPTLRDGLRSLPGRLMGGKRSRAAPAAQPAVQLASGNKKVNFDDMINLEDSTPSDSNDLQDTRVLWRASLWRAYLQTQQLEQDLIASTRDGM
jgi:O-antigen/teichoic acid export membrane protein